MTSDTSKKKSDEDILALARKRFLLAEDAEKTIREDALDDLNFSAGKQWPDDIKNSRELDKRPCLTINRLPQFIRQVTNDQRQNRPSIKVSPVDDQADPETAKVFQGLIRHIEYDSNADVAYDTAFDGAVRQGFGYYRLVTEYSNPFSFEQDLKIKRIRNHFSVYLDPNYQEPDGSDAQWGFVFEDVTIDDFKDMYPKAELTSMSDWRSLGDMAPGWMNGDFVRVAEYLYIEKEVIDIVLLSNGQILKKSELPEALPEGIVIQDERKSTAPVVHHCKTNGIEILSKTVWPGSYIPIFPVLGDELDVNGERILEGIVRHAKDPQRMYNYWSSSQTETIALAPRAPWIGVEGQFEGFENDWETANTRNHAYLEYKATTIAGQPVGPPQRNVYEPPVQAITQAKMQSSEDLKGTTGIYDASLGNRSNENSGVAIQRRNMQAQTSNFHFIDNLSRSLRHLGRCIIEVIPKIYDTPRMIRIIGEDGTQDIVAVNQEFEKDGKTTNYQLSAGKYDVTVSTGPSFQTKRQEASEYMLEFIKAYPAAAQVIGDLIAKNQDWPGHDEVSERLRKMVPPQILGDDKNNKEIPPQAQQQLAQMDQMIQQLTQQLNQAHDQIDQKKIEAESKERIEMAKLEVQYAKIEADMRIELLKQEAATNHASFEAEIAQLDQRQKFMALQNQREMKNEEAQENESSQMNQQPTGGQSPGQPMEQ